MFCKCSQGIVLLCSWCFTFEAWTVLDNDNYILTSTSLLIMSFENSSFAVSNVQITGPLSSFLEWLVGVPKLPILVNWHHHALSAQIFFAHLHIVADCQVLSLRLQFGWHLVTLAWLLTMSLVVLLGSLRVLPMPTTLQQNLLGFTKACPAGPWAFVSSCVVIFATIYCWPSLIGRFQHPTCFLDIVSISQSDTELQALWQFEIKLLWINFGLESNQERKSSSLLIGFCS